MGHVAKQFTRYVYVERVSPRFRVRGGCACVSSRGRVPFQGTFTPASHVRTQAIVIFISDDFYPVWMTPVANPTASPPKGTAKTARPRMNQMSTPPNADFSYLALCALLYFFASSTQQSLLSFIARDGIVVLGGEMRCLAGGATGKDRVGPGIARAANEARARGRTRATAPAGSIAATMRRAACCVLRALKDTLDRLAFIMGKKTWRKVPNFVYTDR